MSFLSEIAADAKTKGACTADWRLLRNLYFSGDDPIGQIKTWAAREGLHASFDYAEESPTHVVVRSVTFAPLPPPT